MGANFEETTSSVDHSNNTDTANPTEAHAPAETPEQVTPASPVEPSSSPVLQAPDAVEPSSLPAESTVFSEETLAEEPIHQDHPLPTVSTKKSSRPSKPSIWLKDYVTTVKSTKDTPYIISNFITYDHLSENYKSFLGSFSEPTEPRSFKEAWMTKHGWKQWEQKLRHLRIMQHGK